MSQFKPGDMALVVGGKAFLGQQVELVQFVDRGGYLEFKGVEYQLKPDAKGSGWACTDGDKMCVKLESQLIPLKGDFAPEQQKSREVVA